MRKKEGRERRRRERSKIGRAKVLPKTPSIILPFGLDMMSLFFIFFTFFDKR